MRKLTTLTLLVASICISAMPLPSTYAAPANENPQKNAPQIEFMQPNLAITLPGDPEAEFIGARVVYNVTVRGRVGMRVHAKFRVRYGYNVPCRMIAYFYYDDDANTPLKSGDDDYTTVDGKVSASAYFTPKYDPAIYDDLQIFMPYDALNMEEGNEYDLKFYLALYDNEGQRFFGKSGWYRFHLTMP